MTINAALRGATLEERLRFTRGSQLRTKEPNAQDYRRLELWRSWFGISPDSLSWLEFLQRNQLTENRLIALEQPDFERYTKMPWIAVLSELKADLGSVVNKPNYGNTILENLTQPLVRFAWNKLSARLTRFDSRLFSQQATAALRRSLLHKLAHAGHHVINWEVSAVLAQRRLVARRRPNAQLQKYFFSHGVNREVITLLEDYPALGRLWATQISHWWVFVEEFADHVDVFSRQRGIRRARPCWITRLQTDCSDSHDGNRSVMSVDFANGQKFFYKPRSGQAESEWFALLEWLNGRGFVTPFRIPQIRCEQDHCWLEAVPERQPRTSKQVKDFCFRAGALMCIAHILRGVDFHKDNVVSSGDQPVVVDCEALLHPSTSLPKQVLFEDASILRTGFLPLTRNVSSSSAGIASCGAMLPAFADNISHGFREMHTFIRSSATIVRRIRRAAEHLKHAPRRTILRPSIVYASMLDYSNSKSLARDGRDRSIFLWACCSRDRLPRHFLRQEVQRLEDMDIPILRGRASRAKLDLTTATLTQSTEIINKAFRTFRH